MFSLLKSTWAVPRIPTTTRLGVFGASVAAPWGAPDADGRFDGAAQADTRSTATRARRTSLDPERARFASPTAPGQARGGCPFVIIRASLVRTHDLAIGRVLPADT